jgi:hypothetical protein
LHLSALGVDRGAVDTETGEADKDRQGQSEQDRHIAVTGKRQTRSNPEYSLNDLPHPFRVSVMGSRPVFEYGERLLLV